MAAWRFRFTRVFPPLSDGAIILGRERPTCDTMSFSDNAHREHGLMVFFEKKEAKASSSGGRTVAGLAVMQREAPEPAFGT
jgi:hypothetical protein